MDNSYLNSPGLINYELCKEFQEAQSKVLFEGWKIEGNYNKTIFICHKNYSLTFLKSSREFKLYKTIEDLQKLGIYLTAEGRKESGV